MSTQETAASTSATPPVGFDMATVYETFSNADRAVSELQDKVARQTRNGSRTADRVTHLEDRVLNIERSDIIG